MVTIREAAALCGCSRQRIAKLVKAGRFAGAVLTSTPVGSYWLVPEAEAAAFAAAAPARRAGGRPRKSEIVRLCPHCQAPATRADEQAGKCPGCGGLLLWPASKG